MVKYLSEGLPRVNTDWSKWVLAFCDERVVPEDSEDSTFGVYSRQLIPKSLLEKSQFITLKQGLSGKFLSVFHSSMTVNFNCNRDANKC